MQIGLKNDLSEIDRLASELKLFCDRERLPVKIGLELNLVLEELVTNTISYAFSDRSPHLITVSIERHHDRIKATIEDEGIGFNPLENPPPQKSNHIDDLEPGGLGIHLVRELTEQIEYRREAGRNILSFVKKVSSGTDTLSGTS